jgi:hypothetical protein
MLRSQPSPKWRILAHFGAFSEEAVADLKSQKCFTTDQQKNVYHRRKRALHGVAARRLGLPNRL